MQFRIFSHSSQMAPTSKYCKYCNRPGHIDSICQTHIAHEQNNSPAMYQNDGNHNKPNQTNMSTGGFNPPPNYAQQYTPYCSQGNYSQPIYQEQNQNYQGQTYSDQGY